MRFITCFRQSSSIHSRSADRRSGENLYGLFFGACRCSISGTCSRWSQAEQILGFRQVPGFRQTDNFEVITIRNDIWEVHTFWSLQGSLKINRSKNELCSNWFTESHDDVAPSFVWTSSNSFPIFLYNFRSQILSSFPSVPDWILTRRFSSSEKSCLAFSAFSSMLTNSNLPDFSSLLKDRRISRQGNFLATETAIVHACPSS